MQPRQPPQRLREVPVGARIILRPTGAARVPVQYLAPPAEASAAETRLRVLRIHQTREDPLRLLLPILRKGNVVVRLHADELPEGLLKGQQRAGQRQSATADCDNAAESHGLPDNRAR